MFSFDADGNISFWQSLGFKEGLSYFFPYIFWMRDLNVDPSVLKFTLACFRLRLYFNFVSELCSYYTSL